jgi:hypothetical protein
VEIRPNKRYTQAEITELRNDPRFADFAMKGYVLRLDEDMMFSFVHWTQATSGRNPGELRRMRKYHNPRAMEQLTEGLEPIVKRTPQQRVDSLMLRFIEECKRAGTVPGLQDPFITTIVGEAWKSGITEITAETVRRVAQSFLEKADRKFQEEESRRVTRTTGSSRAVGA